MHWIYHVFLAYGISALYPKRRVALTSNFNFKNIHNQKECKRFTSGCKIYRRSTRKKVYVVRAYSNRLRATICIKPLVVQTFPSGRAVGGGNEIVCGENGNVCANWAEKIASTIMPHARSNFFSLKLSKIINIYLSWTQDYCSKRLSYKCFITKQNERTQLKRFQFYPHTGVNYSIYSTENDYVPLQFDDNAYLSQTIVASRPFDSDIFFCAHKSSVSTIIYIYILNRWWSRQSNYYIRKTYVLVYNPNPDGGAMWGCAVPS